MRPSRARRALAPGALALALLLAGCLASVAPTRDDAPAGALACAGPCGVVVETGRLWEPMIAVDPTDPLHWVASSQVKAEDPARGGTSWALSHVTFDGGATWETRRLPGGSGVPADHPLATATWLDDSVPAFLPDGTLVWTVLAFETGEAPGALVATGADLVSLVSRDGGLTFPEAVVVATGSGGDARVGALGVGAGGGPSVFHDKQWIAVGDDGALLLLWSENWGWRPDSCGEEISCTRLLYATSADGLAWSAPRALVEEVVSGAFPLLLADGAWLVAFHDTRNEEAEIARSTDKGATWEIQTLAASTKFPVLARASTAAGERVHVAYPRGQDGRDGEQDVVVRSSDDGGATWSAETLVHAPASPGRTIPAIAGTPAGDALVTFWSPREDGADYLAQRVRDGVASGPLLLGTHAGPTSATGDYMGLAALPGGRALAAWTASDGDAFALRVAVLSL